MRQLDRIDLRILDELQRDGRISMTALAERVALSTTPCTERVRRLERDGVIAGYHARVNPDALGRSLLVFVELTLASKSADVFKAVREALLLEPRIIECHLISGSFDYLIKARLTGMREYRDLLGQILSRIPVPAQSNSFVVMEEVKEAPGVPINA